jgi:hypothetical protein
MTQVLGITIEITGRPFEGGPWGYEKIERFPAVLTDELRQCYPTVTYVRVRDAGGMEDADGFADVHIEMDGDENISGTSVAWANAMQSDERIVVRDAVTALAHSLWTENQWLSGAEMESIMSARLLAMIDEPA